MLGSRDHIRFMLNDAPVVLEALSPEKTLLDFLRLERGLTGTKEGCAEGDCGACTVLVGRLTGGALDYQTINACICLMGSLDGAHVVTIEHLHGAEGQLHPVQQAMVDHHGSQCGFCTPGIVMSLYALWMREPSPDHAAVEKALQGNLCRCTGYAPIVRAGLARDDYWDAGKDALRVERDKMTAQLAAWRDGGLVELGAVGAEIFIPASLDDLAAVLEAHPEARIVAGATDVGLWVTKFMRKLGVTVFTGHVEGFDKIESDAVEEGARGVRFFGGVSYTDAAPVMAEEFPFLIELWDRIGGEQVRNAGTLGGNIANGSPIGDTPPPFIALGARLCLRRGATRRVIALEDFFIDYGKQDKRPGEFVEWIFVPYSGANTKVAAYKLSKRRDEDISSLLGAFAVELVDGQVVAARIAFGGMAPTPKRARTVEAVLTGKDWNQDLVAQAAEVLGEDFSPISDMRASAEYRLLAGKNLLRRFFLETQGEPALLMSGGGQ